jgi:hypothetical protein
MRRPPRERRWAVVWHVSILPGHTGCAETNILDNEFGRSS